MNNSFTPVPSDSRFIEEVNDFALRLYQIKQATENGLIPTLSDTFSFYPGYYGPSLSATPKTPDAYHADLDTLTVAGWEWTGKDNSQNVGTADELHLLEFTHPGLNFKLCLHVRPVTCGPVVAPMPGFHPNESQAYAIITEAYQPDAGDFAD